MTTLAIIRTCSKCQRDNSQTEFYRASTSHYCKECTKRYNADYIHQRRENARIAMLVLQKVNPVFDPLKLRFIEDKIKLLEIALIACSGPFNFICLRSEMQYQTELYLQMAKLKPRK